MTRAARNYSDEAPIARHLGADISKPVEGYFRHRLRSGGVRGGVRIFYGPPRDPVTGEEMDRSWRWQAEFDGVAVPFDDIWPACVGDPITEGDYQAFCARKRWAQQHAPDSAYADPTRKIDLLSRAEPLPF